MSHPDLHQNDPKKKRPFLGLVIASSFGIAGAALVALATPFLLPALRKHCLPYVPATSEQLDNLLCAFKRHAKSGDKFIDIGSGDGRICRLASDSQLFSQVHGVELNSLLVLYSRAAAAKSQQYRSIKIHRKNLWHFPLNDYECICIFGVESMMAPLGQYLTRANQKSQTIFACRFPFKSWRPIDEIGTGIDTVWVYKLNSPEPGARCTSSS